MSQGSSPKFENRSWTADPNPDTNRTAIIAFLAVLLALLIGLVFYWLWNNSASRTFAVSFAVTDNDARVSQPKFGVWDLNKFEVTAAENGLKPWSALPSKKYQDLQNRPDMEGALSDLPRLLEGEGLNGKDTLIVQLRCHAVVALYHGEWTCGLFVGESSARKTSEDETVYPIDEFLKRLLKIPAKNIVLLADVCDLKSVPHRGWLVNPVATFLLKSCEKLAMDSNPNKSRLWVICSAADGQPAIYSTKREQTLFESACQYSLQRINGENSLSLADYFDAIVRYCYAASDGKQTPLMILANKSEFCSPNTDESWRIAKQVLLCRNQGKVKSKDSNQGTPKAAESAQPSQPVSTNKSQIDGESKSAEMLDDNKSFRFWQLRDRIAQRGSDRDNRWRWSPADFAPFLWRRMQMEAAADSTKAEQYEQELNDFQRVQEAGVLVNSEISPLLQAWNDFLESNKNQKLWKDELVLTNSERDAWIRIRAEYRKYIESVSELIAWRDLALEFPNELQDNFDKLSESLAQARGLLPDKDSEFALKKSSDLRLTDSAFKSRQVLINSLKSIVEKLQRASKLSWLDEHYCQVLLASPLLSYQQRKDLSQLFSKAETKDPISRNDADLRRLLERNDSATSNGLRYCKGLRRSLVFYADSNIDPPASDMKSLLNWGQSYREISESSPTLSNDRTLQYWHFLSLIEFGFVVSPGREKSYSGIVVSPTKAKAIRLALRPDFKLLDFPRGRSDSKLAVEVKFADDSDVSKCDLKWSIISPTNNSLPGFQLQVGSNPLKRDSKELVVPRAKELEFNCRLAPDQRVPDICSLQLIAFDSEGNASNPLLIPLFRNASQIQLSVSLSNRGVKELLPSRKSDEPSLNSIEQFDFDGPALFGATSRYSFALGNKQLTERKGRLKVYVIPRNDAARLLSEKKLPDKFLVAESQAVMLPAYGAGAENVPVKLAPAKNATTSKPTQSKEIDTNYEIMIFQIDELEIKADSETVRGNSEHVVGRFKPSHPASTLTVNPSPVEMDQALKIGFETTEKLLQKYDLKEISVEIRSAWTDLKSKTPPFGLPTSLKKLDEERLVETLVGEPMDRNKSFQFDVDIGRYPRALRFRANPKSPTLDRDLSIRVEIDAIKPRSNQFEKEIELKKVGSRWVFPNKVGEIAVSYDEIRIDAIADFGLDPKGSLLFSKESGGISNLIERQEIETDRTVFATLAVTDEEGLLTVSYSPSQRLEIHQKRGIDERLNGIYSVQLTCAAVTAKSEMIFDRVVPKPAKIQCNGNPELYLGGKLELLVEPDDGDEGSGVETVLFAISKVNDFANTEYDPNRIATSLDMSAWDRDRKRCRVYLDSKSLAGTPSATVVVVARTIDRAGNFQDKNTPIAIRWQDKKSPASTSKE